MFVDLTPEQHRLRLQVRDYFNGLMTPELRVELRGAEGGPLFRRLVRQMGADGWLAAYAKSSERIVVTLEEHDPVRRNKVPLVNLCRAFDVATITPFELLRRLDVQLDWQPAL